MDNGLINIVTEEFRCWLEQHPERVEAALEGLTDLDVAAAITSLPRSQAEAITTLVNLLAKATGRD
jgi:hypothetical protein